MTEALDPEIKQLRKMKPGELADTAGTLKAQMSELQDRLDRIREEAVRRDLREAEGAVFRLVLSPPSTQMRLDRAKLEKAFGENFIEIFSRPVETGWTMRVHARTQKHDRGVAAPSEAA